MAYSPVPTVTTSDLWTAGQHNTYCRGNAQQSIPYVIQSAGDVAYALTANSIGRLAFGAKSVLISGSTAPEWMQYEPSAYRAFSISYDGGAITNRWRYIGDMAYVTGAAQSINNATETAITYDASWFGSSLGTWSSSAASRLVIPANFPAGRYYRIIGYLHTPGSAYTKTGMTRIRFRKNGSTYFGGNMESHGSASSVFHLSAVEIVKLEPGNYIEMMAYHNNGSAMEVFARRLAIFMVV